MRRLVFVLAIVGCGGNGNAPTKVTPASVPPRGDMGRATGSPGLDLGATGGTDGGVANNGGGGNGSGGTNGNGRDLGGVSGGGSAGDMGRGGAGAGDMAGPRAACTLSGQQSLFPQVPAPDNQLW